MRSILKAGSLALLLGAALACEEDDRGFTGEFTLTVSETLDTCDGMLHTFSSDVEIRGTVDDLEVRFGDDAVLTGALNNQNFFEVSGDVLVTVDPDSGPPIEVASFMEMVFEVFAQGRRLAVEEGRLTYEGTHPSKPGVTCVQEFIADGQRASLGPLL